jgi:hypothetical protein
MNNGDKYDIGFANWNLLKAWSYYNPEQKRWIFYNVAKEKAFDLLYENLKSMIEQENKPKEMKN